VNIVFDIDGVLVDTPQKVEELTKLFFNFPEFRLSTYYAQSLPYAPEVRDFVDTLFNMPQIMAYMEPSPETVKIVRRLQEKHKVHIVTSRPSTPEVYAPTCKMMADLFGIFPYFGNKRRVLEALKADLFIEDRLETAHLCASDKTTVLLIDRPYNQGNLVSNMRRIHSLREVGAWSELLKKQ